jgi:hypothetical protein
LRRLKKLKEIKMKSLRYSLILVILICSVTAYGHGRNSVNIGIALQSAYQPVYVYRQPVLYAYPQPVYVNSAPVYVQPTFGLSFSTFWSGGGHGYYGGHRGYYGGGRGHR